MNNKITSVEIKQFIQNCLDLANTYPEPYRTQAIEIIGKKQNWPDKLEKLNTKMIKELMLEN